MRFSDWSSDVCSSDLFGLCVGVGRKKYFVTKGDLMRARQWFGQGFVDALKTPDNTLVFVTPDEKTVIRKDQADCMGCLSQCSFSSRSDEHTSELQSLMRISYAALCLKNKQPNTYNTT